MQVRDVGFVRPRTRQISRGLTQWALTLHIYLSMTGFLLIILFAVTGLTLNHADFGLSEPQIETSTLTLPDHLLGQPEEQQITDHLREQLGVTSPVTLYKQFPEEIEVLFAAPGKRTHVIINREEKTAAVERETRGLLGKIGDLHKGRDSGRLWFWIIDITAVLLTISSLTGIVTLASLPARRRGGFVFGALGLFLAILLYLVWVPK